MITRVQVKNFRNLADIDVQLGPLTVLVGRNGTGKSTFLDVLRFVRDALRLGLETAISQRGGIGALGRSSSDEPVSDIEITIDAEAIFMTARYSFSIGVDQEEKIRVTHETLERTYKSNLAVIRFETRNGIWTTTPTDFHVNREDGTVISVASDTLALPFLAVFLEDLKAIRDILVETNFYAIFPNTLRPLQRQTSEAALLEDGQNLAAILRQMIKQDSFHPDLVSALGQVVEGVRGIRVKEVGGYLVTELEHEAQNGQTAWFPLAQESVGTLRVLGLLAALYQSAPHSLIAIEEPELSIHPGALAMLSEVIEEAATRSQIIITTQSPDLISCFNADQLRIVETVSGSTHIGPLEEAQREAINNQLFSAGDLLRIEGLHTASPREIAVAHA